MNDIQTPGSANRIEIMRPDARVYFSGHTLDIEQHHLLRLLVLRGDRVVPNIDAGQILEVEPDSVKSKVRDLRRQLERVGCEGLIRTRHGMGYQASLAGWEVDSEIFRTGLKDISGSAEAVLKQPMKHDEAVAQQKKLALLLDMWKANPAQGLPPEDGLESHFAKLKQRAEDQLLLTRLCSGVSSEIRDAATELDHRLKHNTSAEIWVLLLHAHHALSDTDGVVKIMERVLKQYGPHVPQSILRAREVIGRPASQPIFRLVDADRPAPVAVATPIPSTDNLDAVCRTLGISTASYLKLSDSELTPEACMRRTKNKLLFSGVLASKWVTEPAIRSDFSKLLSRLDESNGEVKFMVIDPESDAFRRLTEIRRGAVSTESLGPLRALVARHKCFELRMFDVLPAFRIVVIDNDVVGFSPYRLSAEAYVATERGWRAPHVVLDPQAPYPLAEAFELLFRETWNTATPIEVRK